MEWHFTNRPTSARRKSIKRRGKETVPDVAFRKILCAYDGSEHAFEAFKLALAVAKQSDGELHIVSVGEIARPPQFIQDIREEKAAAERRLRALLFRARSLTTESKVTLQYHVLAGNPVRVIVRLASDLNVELLVIGTRGHSALYELLVRSRAGQIVQLALCPVLVVKHVRKGQTVRGGGKFKRWFDQQRWAEQSIGRGGSY